MPRGPRAAAGRFIGQQVIQQQHVPPAVRGQVREHPVQMPAGAAMPERRHPQRPVASEVESLEVPGVEEVIPVSRDLVRIGLVGERQDVQAELPGTGYLLARTAGLVGPQAHPQGRVPAEEGAHARGDILDRAAAWQVHHSLHAELVAAVLHVLPDRLLAPGQRLDPGPRPR